MAYNIVKSNGTPLVTINDGQTNNTATSLTLVGKNFAGYGTFLNENFIQLLENFASATTPANPMVGQLWYQTSTNLLQVYNGNAWKSISGAQSLADAPTYKVAGDLWFDSVNQQLKVWSGSNWIVIGPSFTSTTGQSGAVADTIIDSSQYSHVVVKFFVQNQLVAVLNKDASFQPATTIPGFPSIKPGFNLAQGTSVPLVFYENANNASYLGQLPAAQYLTVNNAQLSSQLKIKSNDGILLTDSTGTQSNFQIDINNNNVQLQSLIRNYGFIISTYPDSAGGASQNVLTVDKTTGLITVLNEPTDPTGIATKGYVDHYAIADTRTMLQTNVAAINSNIATLISNVLTTTSTYTPGVYSAYQSTYGNVRNMQSDLGFNSTANATARANYLAIVSTGGQTFATNITAIWNNLAVFSSNVTGGGTFTDTGGTVNSSILANVISLQGRTSTVESGKLERSGSLSITGTLKPDTGSSYGLGGSGKTFANIWVDQVITSGSIINLQTVNGTGSTRSRFDPMQIICNPLTITGNIKFNENINGTPTSNVSLGVDGPLRVQGTLSHSGDIVPVINATGGNGQNIGSTGLAYNNVYAVTLNASSLNISGSTQSSAAASFGAITTSGDFLPATDNTYNIGTTSGSNKRWLTVNARSFASDTGVSIGTNGIRLNAGTAQDIGSSGSPFATLYAGQWVGTTFTTSTSKFGLTSGSSAQLADSTTPFTSGYINTLYGKATSAQYADLAERYESDAGYVPGTVVTIGGEKEITMELGVASEDVFGVISTSPAHLMNDSVGSDTTHPPVALTGRVPVRVVGEINKGQRIVSAGFGLARAAHPGEATPFNVIGRALESKSSAEEGLVECVVRLGV